MTFGLMDKSARKNILAELKRREREQFEASLPMSRDKFKGLFDYLDEHLKELGCTDEHDLTLKYLGLIGINDSEPIIAWLEDHGGFCDCEILANVEEKFE